LSLSDKFRHKMAELEAAIGSGKTKEVFNDIKHLVTDALWNHDMATLEAYQEWVKNVFLDPSKWSPQSLWRLTREGNLQNDVLCMHGIVNYALGQHGDEDQARAVEESLRYRILSYLDQWDNARIEVLVDELRPRPTWEEVEAEILRLKEEDPPKLYKVPRGPSYWGITKAGRQLHGELASARAH
jgi:hypothetical protein